MTAPVKSLGQIAYEAYADAVAWRCGADALNGWGTLSDTVRAGWEASAISVSALSVQAEQVGTLFKRPHAGYMNGRQLFHHLVKLVDLPACGKFVIEADGPHAPVKVTMQAFVRTIPEAP